MSFVAYFLPICQLKRFFFINIPTIFLAVKMSSASDNLNRSAGDNGGIGSGSDNWVYKTVEMESGDFFDQTATGTLDLHGLTIRDIAERHVENFLTGIEHELVEKFLNTFAHKSTAIANQIQTDMTELQRKHEKEQSAFENKLQKLNDELMQNAIELESFLAKD